MSSKETGRPKVELYALTFKDTGEILTPASFREYWKNYGNNTLYGWRPPKKVYYTLGTAKTGFSHVPDDLKPLLNISILTKKEDVIDGAELFEKQKAVKDKRLREREEWEAKQRLENAKEKFERAQKELERLNNVQNNQRNQS